MHILVIDSSLLNSRTLAILFESFACSVTVASGIEEAVNVVRSEAVDAVIVGNGFAAYSGTELRAAIKSVRPELCIAMISDTDYTEDPGTAVDFYLRPTHFYTDLCRRNPVFRL